MARRKWLARGLVLLVVGGLAAGGLLYQHWTNPAAVRQQVIDQLNSQFVGVQVNLESARLRLFGGIAVRELRLVRRDDLDHADFAYFPSATIYHDKEQLLDGKLAVRKLELHRPRLRIVRGHDGRWNWANILGQPELDKPLPTVVFQRATIIIEDRTALAGTPPLEIREVQLTLINDPVTTVTLEGTGTSDLAKTMRIQGKWQRDTGDTTLHLELDGIPAGPELAQRFKSYCPELVEHLRLLQGTGKLEGDLQFQPERAQPLSHQFRFHLSQGKFDHARLPLPLEQLGVTLAIDNGKITDGEATARAGSAKVHLTVKDLTPCCSESLPELCRKLDLTIENLTLTKDIFARLPPDLREIYDDYRPEGPASLTMNFDRNAAGEWHQTCRIQPADLQICCKVFPYPAEHISGTVEHVTRSGGEEIIRLNLTGQASARPVFIKGEVTGSRGQWKTEVDVWGENLPLDEKLFTALPEEFRPLVRSFHATGLTNFRAFIRRSPGDLKYSNRFLVNIHHGAARWDVFRYPLENVSGTLDILPDHLEFTHFRGTHKGGEFRIGGRSFATPQGERLAADIEGENILLDEEMAAALETEPELKKTWQTFSPRGRIDFKGRIDRLVGQKPDIDLTVFPRGCSIQPAFFPILVADLQGKVRYARQWVQLDKITARHGNSLLGLNEGLIYLKPEGGIWARLKGVEGNPLLLEEDFLKALPPVLGKACRTLDLKAPLTLNTELVIDSLPGDQPLVIYWDGSVGLRAASLDVGVRMDEVTGVISCRGRHNGKQLEGVVGNLLIERATLFKQPLRKIHSQFEVTREEPDVLRLPGLHARFFGGEIYGPVRVDFGSTVRYEMNLTAAQVRLEDFGRHNLGQGAELQGLASARLYLTGQGDDFNSLKGSGSIDVPQGKMYNLPVLLDLIKVIGLRLPDRTAFEEAHATFGIEGPRVNISRFDLLGHAISLRGQGQMKLDGSDIDLDFHADWARLNQLLPPGIDRIPMTISNQLLRINMSGRIGEIRCTKEPVPLLMDPIKKMMKGPERGQKRQNPTPGVATSGVGLKLHAP